MFDLMPFDMGRRNLRGFFDDFDKHFFKESSLAMFKTDILDKGDKFVLEAELPGFNKEDIKIDLDDDLLTISAEHSEEKTEKNEPEDEKDENEKDENLTYIHRERTYGSFSRSFHVANIEVDKIEANYDKGVLTLTMPKTKPVTPPTKKIEIK